jgi:RNA polymerase sigma-70 factor (ECF subfamily)
MSKPRPAEPVDPMEQDEATLILAASRDPESFARLYDRYVQPVYRYLRGRVGSAQEAEELTAQTFLAALESLPRYNHTGRFAAWLFSIARRKAVDSFRSRKTLPLDEAEEVPFEVDFDGGTALSDQMKELTGLIRSLKENERELIRLHFTAGLTFTEMASLLGKKEEAVKKSVYRLLERLHRRMEKP